MTTAQLSRKKIVSTKTQNMRLFERFLLELCMVEDYPAGNNERDALDQSLLSVLVRITESFPEDTMRAEISTPNPSEP